MVVVHGVLGVGSANEGGFSDCILLDGVGKSGSVSLNVDFDGTFNVFFELCFLSFVSSVVNEELSDEESNETDGAGDDEYDRPKRERWRYFR